MLLPFKRAFGRITPQQMAANELAEAELKLMEAQGAQEYATAMVGYHHARITRLRSLLARPAANDAGTPQQPTAQRLAA